MDGWWDEAYDGGNGFAVGAGEECKSEEEQDRFDREALLPLAFAIP
ncbi:hypothetical protein H8E52_09405 [bacterium]|nr:hypothetical protein [bacterium]